MKQLIYILTLKLLVPVFSWAQISETKNDYTHQFINKDAATNTSYILSISKSVNTQEFDPGSIYLIKNPPHSQSKQKLRLVAELEFYKPLVELYMKAYPNAFIYDIYMGNPADFADIIVNQVNTFADNASWKKQGNKDGEPNRSLIASLMKKNNVYAPLSEFLSNYNYSIIGFEVDQIVLYHTKEFKTFTNYDYKGKMGIPIPFDIRILISNNEKATFDKPILEPKQTILDQKN